MADAYDKTEFRQSGIFSQEWIDKGTKQQEAGYTTPR